MEKKQERKIRVYNSRANTANPCIILQGKWLADLGFNAGDYLSISCSRENINISIKEKFNSEETII